MQICRHLLQRKSKVGRLRGHLSRHQLFFAGFRTSQSGSMEIEGGRRSLARAFKEFSRWISHSPLLLITLGGSSIRRPRHEDSRQKPSSTLQTLFVTAKIPDKHYFGKSCLFSRAKYYLPDPFILDYCLWSNADWDPAPTPAAIAGFLREEGRGARETGSAAYEAAPADSAGQHPANIWIQQQRFWQR